MRVRRAVLVGVAAAALLVPPVAASAAPPPAAAAAAASGWASAATALFTTCAVRTDATLWCWGSNSYGQLGSGSRGPAVTRPQQVGTRSDWASVVVGTTHVCALDAARLAWCWGEGGQGQLGTGSTADASVPTRIAAAGAWTSLAAASRHTCGTRTDGGLWCWGDGGDGQLGLGPLAEGTRIRSTPERVQPGTTWSRVEAGGASTCGLRTDQTLWCWGRNTAGMLGDGTATTRREPVQVAVGGAWSAATLAGESACGLRPDRSLWCWGSGLYGQLANGVRGTGHRTPRPVAVKQPADWTAVAAGYTHACGLRAGGTLWCWGSDSAGELGLGGTDGRTTPTRVDSSSTWARLAEGVDDLSTCALRTDASLWCWGQNDRGQLGTGDLDDRSRPTQVLLPT